VSNETSQAVTETSTPVVYVVIDGQTGNQVGGEYKSRSRASARVDKLDNAYGAYRYRVQTKA
jgi:hypothetical protein